MNAYSTNTLILWCGDWGTHLCAARTKHDSARYEETGVFCYYSCGIVYIDTIAVGASSCRRQHNLTA